ncbi:MAG: UDP-N-acetylmuramoyl-L-alanine--D-glutamate ligase [Alphaproteobacteria bacterium]|nr:UDP-N-acetylmuramoyl-L-alanine--D-glutamate ligase [Alphaproteobacteria bacterium]
MRAAELASRRVAVWGLGREGRAAIGMLRKEHPSLPLLVLDDAAGGRPPEGAGSNIDYAFGADAIARAIENIDVIVKSPGVSLYRREIRSAREKGIKVTSLLNLWFAEPITITTICVTGTKGKSTTASLVAHILQNLGRRVALVGNIGIPITELDCAAADIAVIEVSSYQAADFRGTCDVAVLTSLYPEHLDWHLTVENYFRDKINLVSRGKYRIISAETAHTVERLADNTGACQYRFNDDSRIHARGTRIFDGPNLIGEVRNAYLARSHNLSNLCAGLGVARSLGIDAEAALGAAEGFRGLPHRQQELGVVDGVLFVDDSISTIPESTAAALAAYAGRDIAVIVGGYDRGIEYRELVEATVGGAARALICLGQSGRRIYCLAREIAARGQRICAIRQANSMKEAVLLARRAIPPGGVVLLSPAAPSYGDYRDYIERGRDFAAHAGIGAFGCDVSHSDR